MAAVYDRVLAFIADARADNFEALALDIFAHQFASCAAYHRYCDSRGAAPQSIADWRDIPPVPVVAFKRADLCCGTPVRTFVSSGTTMGTTVRSRHLLPDLRLYEHSAITGMRRFLFPDVTRMRLASVIPSGTDLPDSSLAQMVDWAMDSFGDPGSVHAASADGIDYDALTSALRESERDGRPLCLLATTGALVRALDFYREHRTTFRLPHGSRLMDTGGTKGSPRLISRNGLLHAAWSTFAIPGYFCVNEYGMAELSSQFYDSVIADRVQGRHRPRRKLAPHWVRTLVLDIDTLRPVEPGAQGLLCHFDLANAGSAMAVLTEDVGHHELDGFQIIGRAPEAEARGCSLSAAEWQAGAPA